PAKTTRTRNKQWDSAYNNNTESGELGVTGKHSGLLSRKPGSFTRNGTPSRRPGSFTHNGNGTSVEHLYRQPGSFTQTEGAGHVGDYSEETDYGEGAVSRREASVSRQLGLMTDVPDASSLTNLLLYGMRCVSNCILHGAGSLMDFARKKTKQRLDHILGCDVNLDMDHPI
ncbi:hypothetical protein L9F63_013494, partial [Diploptera punctata]